VGVVIDTTKVPAREEGMTPYELLLSESQERMLVVAKQGREREVARILEKWDLTAAVIGEVIAEPVYRVVEGDRVVGEVPGIALATDCNGRYVYLDPRAGTRIAVAEAARNVACVGARPMAITNNLNFGNPKRPEVYFQLREAVAGMKEACDALGTPVTGGNVS